MTRRFSPIQIALTWRVRSRRISGSEPVNTSVLERDSPKCRSARSMKSSFADIPRRNRAVLCNECARTSLLAISRFRPAFTVEDPTIYECLKSSRRNFFPRVKVEAKMMATLSKYAGEDDDGSDLYEQARDHGLGGLFDHSPPAARTDKSLCRVAADESRIR